MNSAGEGEGDEWHLVQLGSRAVGGIGLVVVGATSVTAHGRVRRAAWASGTASTSSLWRGLPVSPTARVQLPASSWRMPDARQARSRLEIHAAHGYLLHRFRSPHSNQRNVKYGGSLDNSMRLVLGVTEYVQTVVPVRLPLFVRMPAIDWAASFVAERCLIPYSGRT